MYKTILILLTLFCCTGLSAYSVCSFGDHCYGSIDLLWWNGECDSLNTYTTLGTFANNLVTTESNVNPLSYKWDPGFRIGLDTECTIGQMIYAPYFTATHYRTTANQSFEVTTPGNLALFSVQNALGQLFEAINGGLNLDYSASIDFLYNQYDLGISKILCDNSYILIIPKGGFSYINTRQAFMDNFIGNSSATSFSIVDHGKISYSGFGAVLGMEAHYKIIGNLSFYTSLDISGYVGRKKIAISRLQKNAVTNQVTEQMESEEKQSQGRWVSDIQIGVQYKGCLYNCMQIVARLGWEFLYLPDQVDYLFGDPQSFKLNGLVLGVAAGF